MCEFISYIQKGKKVYYLTGEQVFNTDKGKQLQEKLKSDNYGHAAIRFYYDLPEPDERGREERECTDFSKPSNFPLKIQQSIKSGEFKGFFSPDVLVMLSARGQKEYGLKCLADAEWKKADAEWDKAYAEWKKADAERDKAYAEWKKADAEWNKAYAERDKADAEWKKADADMSIFWTVFSDTRNRIKVWS